MKQLTQQLIQTRVEAGVDLLNRIEPGWEDTVDVSRLQLQSCLRCVLGQVFGHYGDGITIIGLRLDRDIYSLFESIEYGFVSDSDNDLEDLEYDRLTQEWIRQILALREGKRVSVEVEEPVLVGAE